MIKPLSVLESWALGPNHLSNTVALGIKFSHIELQRVLLKPAAAACLPEAQFKKCESPEAILSCPVWHTVSCRCCTEELCP